MKSKDTVSKRKGKPPLNISIKSFTSRLLGLSKWSSPLLSRSSSTVSDHQGSPLHTAVNRTAVRFAFPKQLLLKKQPRAHTACVCCFRLKLNNASCSSVSIIMSLCLAQQGRWNFQYYTHSYLPPEVETTIALLQPIKSNSCYVSHTMQNLNWDTSEGPMNKKY